jgi:hypothetical protein
MASLNSLQMRALAAQTTGIRVAEDEPTAFRLIHTAANAVTSVTVVTATGITLIDADGTSGSIAFGTYSTLGLLTDYINGLTNWKCKILDGLRTTLTNASNLIAGTLTANYKHGEWGYDVKLDTTNTFTFPVRCTYDRSASNNKPASGHRVKLVKAEYVMDVGTAAANKVQVVEWDPVLKTETQIWGAASVDSTSTVTSHDFSKAPITAKEGNDLVFLVTDAASITDAATNYAQVLYTRE